MGFDAKVSFLRDDLGRMKPLDGGARAAFEEIRAMRGRSPAVLREDFMDDLCRDGRREWRCRSGARYFWVCEEGFVHFCESSYGDPRIPLENYTKEHIRGYFQMQKSCSPTCAVAYAHQVSRADEWRPQATASRDVRKNSWAALHPSAPADGG